MGLSAVIDRSIPAYHLINKSEIEDFSYGYRIIDFKNVLSIPVNYLKTMIETEPIRFRLLPPYREHLSQAFARYFMRVGLPADIPAFSKKL